jgi:hypothetical protein
MKQFNILLFLLVFNSLIATAQKNKTFYIGLNSDLFSVPLSDKSIIQTNRCAYFGYFLNQNFNLSVGVTDMYFIDNKTIEKNNGLKFGIGYLFNNYSPNNSLEVYSNFNNSLKSFSSFSNFNYNIGVRSYLFDIAYIGTGVRYIQNDFATISSTNSLNWFCEMGLRLRLSRNNDKPTDKQQ